jgi:hypothetical protein
MSDDELDGQTTAQLALDDTEDAVLLAGDLRVVAAISLVYIGPLDRAAGKCLGAINDAAKSDRLTGYPGIALACGTNRPARARRCW